MLDTGLTVGEVASLTGVPVVEVKKHIKELTAVYPRGGTRFPVEAVLLFLVDGNRHRALQCQIKEKILKSQNGFLESTEEQDNQINFDSIPKDWQEKVQKYIHERAKYIVEDPEILGGTPVIKGTRVTVHSIRGRLKGGETIDDLIQDYPYIPARAFEVADFFAKSNPNLGRPKGWASLKLIKEGNFFKNPNPNPRTRNGSPNH